MPTPVQVLNCQNLKMYFSQLQLVEEGIKLQINQLGFRELCMCRAFFIWKLSFSSDLFQSRIFNPGFVFSLSTYLYLPISVFHIVVIVLRVINSLPTFWHDILQNKFCRLTDVSVALFSYEKPLKTLKQMKTLHWLVWFKSVLIFSSHSLLSWQLIDTLLISQVQSWKSVKWKSLHKKSYGALEVMYAHKNYATCK